MSRPNSTYSFDEGPSADPGIGSSSYPSSSPLNAFDLACSASYNHTDQSGESHLRGKQSEYRATRRISAEPSNEGLPHKAVHFAGQVALPSWPASMPSPNRDGRSVNTRDSSVPRRPQTPYPFRRNINADEDSDGGDTENVLTPPKRQNTPTLVNTPRLQWDFTKPSFAVPSQSTSDGEEEVAKKEETEAEQRNISEAKRNIVRAVTPVPSLTTPIETGQCYKTNGICPTYLQHTQTDRYILIKTPGMPPPRTHQVYTVQRPSSLTPEEQPSSRTSQIPSLLRVLDANLQPQPHLLSPLAERDEQSDHTRSRSELSDVSCAAAPTQSPPSPSPPPPSSRSPSRQARADDEEREHSVCSCPDQTNRSRPRADTQGTRETDPYLFNAMERLSLQMTPVLPVQHVERVDLRCGEVTIPHQRGRGGRVEADKGLMGRGSGKKRFEVKMSMAWVRVKELFCRRGRRNS